MKIRTITLFAAAAVALWAQQSLTIVELSKFIYSSTHQLNGKLSDKEVADYLSKIKLKEKLDEATLERIHSDNPDIGPRTFGALRGLKDKSAGLPDPKPSETRMVYAVKTNAPSNEEQGRIIDAVREYALNYSDQLPDFICAEVTTQYAGPKSGGLSKVGEVSSHLTYFQKRETYQPYLVNGSISQASYEKIPGARSVGDFGSMLLGIFAPSSQAVFEWDRWDRSGDTQVMVFSYKIARENSNWELVADGGQSMVTAYHGSVMIDPKSRVVLQISTIADGIPPGFPIQAAEDTLAYAPRDISGHQFLLPQAVQIRMSGADGQSRLEKRFANYKKYSADSAISFGDPTPDPPPPTKKK
jgi:hypothetical protein